jgi:hypothetical protein
VHLASSHEVVLRYLLADEAAVARSDEGS